MWHAIAEGGECGWVLGAMSSGIDLKLLRFCVWERQAGCMRLNPIKGRKKQVRMEG